MIVISCTHEHSTKDGKDRNGNQRFRCKDCGTTFAAETVRPLGNMRIRMADAVNALGMLLEGLSIRATERLTGIHRDTLDDLILLVGENCQRLLDSMIQNVAVEDVQLDEIWSFVGCKEKCRIARGYGEEMGDSWTFIGIDRSTKLVVAHKVGQRTSATCCEFLKQIDKATTGRFQVSTDGLAAYTNNVPYVLGNRVDFGQLIKTYSSTQEQTRYSPAAIISAEKKPQFGNPDWDRICTSHIERLNLTLRMNLRRFTRLTNGHSKSHKHHVAMQAILFAWYNLCRKHSTIKQTPAMASKLSDHVWTIKELIEKAAG
jgi:transposase-like protein/IS1 family transposase